MCGFYDGTSRDYKIREWIHHLISQAHMLAADIQYLKLRAENQISAVKAHVMFA